MSATKNRHMENTNFVFFLSWWICFLVFSSNIGLAATFGADKPAVIYLSDNTEIDFGARVNAAIEALPSSGGTVDASSIKNSQIWSTSITITKSIKLIFPCVRLHARNANIVILAKKNMVLSGVDVGGCGASTQIVVGGGRPYKNRVIRVLGDYEPALLFPPVGVAATGSSFSGSNIITKVRNRGTLEKVGGFLETIRVGDSITVVGASTRSTAGFVSPIVAISGDQITLADKVPVGVVSGNLIFSLGGYRVPITLGSIQLSTDQLVVKDASKFMVGDTVRISGAGQNSQDFFTSVIKINGNLLTLAENVKSTVSNQTVMFVAMVGKNIFSANEAVEAAMLNSGDWVLIGEWMNYAPNNSDWNRMEWHQVDTVQANRISFTTPLEANYGYAAYPLANGYPLYWRKISGLVDHTHIHDFAIVSEGEEDYIGIEAQNGRLLEVDHVEIKLKHGLGILTVNQNSAFFHDNRCESFRCADFGGLTHSKIQNNDFRNTGLGAVAILELGSAYNVISGNNFLNADFGTENPNVAALGGAGYDFNLIEGNILSGTTKTSCLSLLGGRGNVFRRNECLSGMNGIYLVEWGGPSPVRLVDQNVIEGNKIRNAARGIDISSTLTSRMAKNLNIVLTNDIDASVAKPINLNKTTLVEIRGQ